MPKRISILGSTGSIGVNSLEVISHLKNKLEVIYLTAHRNSDLLVQQALKFKPKAICISDESKYNDVKRSVPPPTINVPCNKYKRQYFFIISLLAQTSFHTKGNKITAASNHLQKVNPISGILFPTPLAITTPIAHNKTVIPIIK